MTRFQAGGRTRDTWQHFDFSVDDGVGTVTLNRPEKLNALTFEAYADLRDLFGQVAYDGKARVIVLRGEGRAFCSGGDVEEIIGELQKFDVDELLAFTRMTGATVRSIRECPLPVIAAVNGVAAGAGSVLALASDFRLLARSAAFAFLFTRVGLAGADMGAAYLLPRIVGLGRATRLLMLGDKLAADEAAAIGLGDLVEDDALEEQTRALARRLADGPALAYSATKVMLTRELDTDLAAGVELEALIQALLMKSQDHAEFYRAWSEGRKPVWTGR